MGGSNTSASCATYWSEENQFPSARSDTVFEMSFFVFVKWWKRIKKKLDGKLARVVTKLIGFHFDDSSWIEILERI